MFLCSLDAKEAFDSIPHSVLFQKALDIIPIQCWRILVSWYRELIIQIKRGDNIVMEVSDSQKEHVREDCHLYFFLIFYIMT